MELARNGHIVKYSAATRVLHWSHAASFAALVVTGFMLYFPPLGFLTVDSWSRLIHRAAALVFIAGPLAYLVARPRAGWKSIKEAFTWSEEDLGWLAAAPGYYFLGDESAMPPQGHMNTGQKLWYLILLVSGSILIVTGIMMWWLKGILSPTIFQWSVFTHAVYFVVVLSMFSVHVYLSVLHPLMRQHGGAFKSMIDGTVTVEYASSHHGRWYEKVRRDEETQKLLAEATAEVTGRS